MGAAGVTGAEVFARFADREAAGNLFRIGGGEALDMSEGFLPGSFREVGSHGDRRREIGITMDVGTPMSVQAGGTGIVSEGGTLGAEVAADFNDSLRQCLHAGTG